ncbi:ATP-binding protein [Brasilonema sp. UFV-L1]|uniref:AAA family ATPase n=1 Tax=Brasilonema sp. UFV-L1 TaxID=2234130 RepID=UPI00145EA021
MLKSTQISVVLGARRVGKTYLIYDLIQDLIEAEGVEAKHVFYCVLNHVHFSGLDIMDLVKAYRTIHNLPREQEVYLFLDEVQHIKDWDQQVANLYDSEKVKVLVSGSSSTLIKNQSSFLTGRQKRFHIYPLDFSEFINFKNYQLTLAESYRLEPILKEYLEVGGFPEWVLERDESYLSELLDAVLFKDIVSIYPVTNAKLLKDLLRWLAVQLTKPLSYSKITNIIGEKSDKTVNSHLAPNRTNP